MINKAFPSPAAVDPSPDVQSAMSVPDAARRLGIGRTQLYALITEGALPSYRIGRRRLLDPGDVERFWESCRCPVAHGQCVAHLSDDGTADGNGSYDNG